MGRIREHIRRLWERVRKRIAAVTAAVLVLTFSLAGLYGVLNTVLVTDSYGNRKMLITAEQDPVALMNLSGIVAKEYDNYFYTTYSGNQMSLDIQRAFDVSVQVDGEVRTAHLTGGTVQDALAEAGVTLGVHDYTEPLLHSAVDENTAVTVHRVVYQDVVTEEEIPYEVEYEYSSLLYRKRWYQKTLRAGEPGVKQITSRERWVDGVLESSQVVDVSTAVEPVSQLVLAYGPVPVSDVAAPEGVTVENNVPSRYSRVITGARCAGYSSGGGRGASGLGLYAGTVAVDPNVIPYGTMMYITSADGSFVYGFAIATDTGTAVREGVITADLYYETYEESVLSAIQYLNIYIL
ncbi:MAG: 3D domain-containing protein [Oscillospiraceae bacterium]|nr:3D domain-containing protein [Oscillospiraceae bacterium]